jgi:hypothetical protein
MRLSEVLPQLKSKFPADLHKERDLPGGGTWWYVPWQVIRDRLDQVCPEDWTISYGDPSYLGDYCHVRCRLTICGVAREGLGSAQINLISRTGKDMSRGNPIERAIADSFKTAAEQFGIAAYLDEQADKATKQEFLQWMQYGGNGKPAAQYLQQQGNTKKPAPKTEPRPFGQPVPPTLITEGQRKRFWAIAQKLYSKDGIRRLLAYYGFESTSQITTITYDDLCSKAQDLSLADYYNQAPQTDTQIHLADTQNQPAPPFIDRCNQQFKDAKTFEQIQTACHWAWQNQGAIANTPMEGWLSQQIRAKLSTAINGELKRLGWEAARGQTVLQSLFDGRTTTKDLSEVELLAFAVELSQTPTAPPG